MTLEFTTTSVEAQISGVKVLVHAPAGTGKTVLLSTAPAPLIISGEKGLLSLKKKNLVKIFGENNPAITYDIPVMKIATFTDLQQALAVCKTNQVDAFQTIGLDSITEMAEQCLANAKATVKDPRQAYGELIEQMVDIVKQFRDLPNKNIVVIAKQAAVDVGNNATKMMPSMPGSKLGQMLPYYFDEVFCLRMAKDVNGNDTRYVQTQPDFQYEAKDRSGSLDINEIPNLTHIFNKILGE